MGYWKVVKWLINSGENAIWVKKRLSRWGSTSICVVASVNQDETLEYRKIFEKLQGEIRRKFTPMA